MGIFKDILGVLGDGLTGEDTYSNYKRGRKITAAMGDFASNPLEAVRRLQQAGYGAEAQDLWEKASTFQNRADALKSQDTNRRIDNNLALDRHVGGLLRGARGRPENWPLVRKTILELRDKRGYDLPFGEPPEAYSDDFLNANEYLGYTPSNIVSMDNNIRTTDTSNQNNIRSTETSARNTDVRAGVSERNNIRTTSTSASNNKRSTAVSRENSIRAANQSNTNNIRSNQTRLQTGGAGGAPAMPPRPPKGPGDKIRGPGGIWTSPDGKSWNPPK